MKMKILLGVLTFVLIFFLLARTGNAGAGHRVLLREITSITLRRGEYTAGRRSSPLPQLECVGGTAYGKYSPKVVQCYNRGWDGRDVQWECKAEMSNDYQFGNIDVTCEGYDYPNDPYILAGSCGLRYELDYSAAGAKRKTFGDYTYTSPFTGRSWFKFESIVYILVVLFILYLVYLMLWPSDGATGGGAHRTGSGGGGGGGGYPPNDGPPPPGWNPQPPNAPPPSYDDSCGGRGSGGRKSDGSSNSGPGFFSGLGMGALGGYLWGRNTGYGGGEYRHRRPWGSSYDSYGYDSGSYFGGGGGYDGSGPSTSSGSGGGTHTSSGFGGTSRR